MDKKRITKYVPEDNPRKFHRHLEHRNPPTEFRFRPSVDNSTLLARRSKTNAFQLAASSSGSLVPTNNNFVDLCTPLPPLENKDSQMDSGYISGPNQTSPPPGRNGSPATNLYTPASLQSTADPTSIPEYRTEMEQSTEQLFFKKYVAKQFTYDSRKAREQLKPIMRKALDRPEDQPMVDRIYLHLNFKEGTIRGEKRRERQRRLPGQRAVDFTQASWECDDYFAPR